MGLFHLQSIIEPSLMFYYPMVKNQKLKTTHEEKGTFINRIYFV